MTTPGPWKTYPLLIASLLAPPASFAAFPTPFNTQPAPGAPMPAAEAAAKVRLPAGFHCTVLAAEPDVCQPIAMTTDARGRLWVAENYSYTGSGFSSKLRDRIVIFEDSRHTGHFDKRTVFWEGAQRLTSIEVGLGGVWALCLPNLVFIPDRNGDDVPDGPPEVMLDGFDFTKGSHTVANGLRWGPDGWLYGRHGILGTSLVGRPGASPAQRLSMNVGIWRFHPLRHTFEIVAEGTTNPWGMDWDAQGEPFFINTVIGQLWHLIPGAHYRRMSGEDPNPRTYELIEQTADHVNWPAGQDWVEVRNGETDALLAAGGGHAHAGLLIYQGGQWPAEWNGKLLTINFHGRRFNVERLERSGGGFVGRREPDNFFFADPWFRGLDLIAAPDGGVFVSDWSDTGECHNRDGVHRTSGRIFRLDYGEAKGRPPGDLAGFGEAALAELQRSDNDWLSRQARRVLADRAAAGASLGEAHARLTAILENPAGGVLRLRALWALQVSGGVTGQRLTSLLSDPDESVRAWAIRLVVDGRPAAIGSADLDQFVRLAKSDSARVRLTLASALQRLPWAQRLLVAAPLLAHAEDAADHNLPLMLWYGIEPLAASADLPFGKLLAEARIPRVQRLGARRLAEDIDSSPARVNSLLVAMAAGRDPAGLQAVLDGIAESLAGRRQAAKPASWDALLPVFSAGASVRLLDRLRDLSALFGDGRALDEFRAFALDDSLGIDRRRAALAVLVESRAPGLRPLCERLLHIRGLSRTATAGLALESDSAVADLLVREWPHLQGDEKPAVVGALVSRPAWAAKLLEAIAAGTIPRASLNVFQARQIKAYGDPALSRRLAAAWGSVPSGFASDRAAALAQWEPRFTPALLAQADRTKGRAVFLSTCAICHTLNGEGGHIAPDLTGAARDNLDYLLEKLLLPHTLIPEDYRLTTLTLKDGRVLSGMIRHRTAAALQLQTLTDLVPLAASEIVKEEPSAASLMPPGLLENLDPTQARNLMAYLMWTQNLPSHEKPPL